MSKFIDLTGEKIKTFTVMKYIGIVNGQARWLCMCDECKIERELAGPWLRKGKVKCECQKTHHCKHPLYATWCRVRYNSCGEWENSFDAFVSDVKERPEGLYFARIDTKNPHSKDNYRWSSSAKHGEILTHDGETMNMSDWANRLGISSERMRQRVDKGLPEDRLFAPKQTIATSRKPLTLHQKVNADLRGKQPKPADVIKLAKKYGVQEWQIDKAIAHNRPSIGA